ncbi:type VII secretion protein EssB [Metabacillus litoralis]|uniref:type VII secretion protein EssB n=1 Tax=Metabacillus litoralis TaxID=152268 RepID=UPI001CFEF54C|nr:type VII secretion protein EssB [Metabacillus litoralis]
MSQNDISYLPEQLEADITREENSIIFTFQKEKIKLDDSTEISFITNINPTIKKDIRMMDDALTIHYTIPNTYSFLPPQLKQLDERERLFLTYKVVQQANQHALSRIHLLVCPENIALDKGLNPYFLHHGVKESLPPYEKNHDQLLKEVKATVTSIVESQYTFEQYVHYYQTLKLSTFAKKIFEASSYNDLLVILEERIQILNEQKPLIKTVNKKAWKLNRYVLYGVTLLLIPSLIYCFYSLFSIQPKQASFIQAQELFLQNNYSEVVTELQPYDIDDMPKVTQYELALAYIINESLTEDQKETVRNTITLQSDPQYFKYWILIGRGEAEEALDIARYMEDRDLILFGLLKHKEQVKSDDDLKREERQQLLADIEDEIKEYQREVEEELVEETEVDQPVSNSVQEESATEEDKEINNDEESSKANIKKEEPTSTDEKQDVPEDEKVSQ